MAGIFVNKLLRSAVSQKVDDIPMLKGVPLHPSAGFQRSSYIKDSPAAQLQPLYGAICRAVLDYINGSGSSIGLTKIETGRYAAEKFDSEGKSVVATMSFTEKECVKAEASIVTATGAFTNITKFGQTSDETDTSVFFAIYIHHALQNVLCSDPLLKKAFSELHEDIGALQVANFSGTLTDETGKITTENLMHLYRANDFLSYFSIPGTPFGLKLDSSSNLSKLRKEDMDTLVGGEVVLGSMHIIKETEEMRQAAIPKTLGKLKEYIKTKFKPEERVWTEEQKAMICHGHGDDWVISDALMDIITMYFKTKNSDHPMLNISYRGPTGVGKSEDVKVMSEVLNMPLYIVTCCSTTRTEDFMSKQVPNTSLEQMADELPGFDEMQLFPAESYEAICGVENADATPDDCVQALLRKGAAENSGFILTYAAYLMGLMGGGIVEIQEASRIKDASTLVGLNEFCRQRAVIPLADGRTAERSPDAICIWTDNFGYESCRRKEASVKRRYDADIIAPDLTDEQILQRIKHNFKPEDGFDVTILPEMLSIWREIKKLSNEEDLDEEVPWTDLKNWVYLLNLQGSYRGFGLDTIRKTLNEAILNKFVEDSETKSIAAKIALALDPKLSKLSAVLE